MERITRRRSRRRWYMDWKGRDGYGGGGRGDVLRKDVDP